MSSPVACLNALSTAPVPAKEIRRVQITHPFHPLSGKQFDLVEHRCSFGSSYLYFHDDCGRLREIPAIWTDFVQGDVFVEMARGRSPLHSECLLELADLVQRIARGVGSDV
jgi:Family of unknown function (DUF5372)